MIRGIARLLAKIFGTLVLLSAIIFIIVAFNERETASVLANSLWATLQGGRDIEATSPQPHVDYLAEPALRISFLPFWFQRSERPLPYFLDGALTESSSLKFCN